MSDNPNLNLLMEKIFDDEEIVNKIMATDDMFELYALCQKVQDGYTFDEFAEFFENLVCMCIDEVNEVKEAIEENAEEIGKLKPEDLDGVSGGVGTSQKFTASVLASLMFMTSTGASASGSSKNIPLSGDVLLRDASEVKAKRKAAQEDHKFLNWLDKVLDSVWDNKGKVLLSALALIGGGAIAVGSRNTLVKNVQDRFKEKRNVQRAQEENEIIGSDIRPKDYDRDADENRDKSEEEHAASRQRVEELQRIWDDTHSLMEQPAIPDLQKPQLPDGREYRSLNDQERQTYDSQVAYYNQRMRQYTEDLAVYDAHTKIVVDKANALRIKNQSTIDAFHQKGLLKSLTNGVVGLGMLATLGGGVRSALKEITEVVNKLSTTAKDIETLRIYQSKANQTIKTFQEEFEIASQKLQSKNYDAEAEEERLRFLFDKCVRGQQKAKEQIMEFFTQFNAERKAADMGASSSELPKPKMLIFNGSSGTGKTFVGADILSPAITKVKPYVITADDILNASKSMYGGMPAALLYGNTKQGGSSKDDASNMNMSCLASFLIATEGTVRVVVIDEWDKLYKKDAQGGYPETHPLDETFRSIIDDRLKDYDGHHIDLSGTVFICTTNETTASLQGRIKSSGKKLVEALVDDKGEPIHDEFGRQLYGEPTKDKSGTQTVVPHDGSLMARLSGSICYFDELTYEDYGAIARDALGDDRDIHDVEDYAEAGRPDKVALQARLIHDIGGVVISDEGYNLIAEYASEMQNGARSIVGAGGTKSGSVSGNLSAAVNTYIAYLKNTGKSYQDLVLLAEPYVTKDSTQRKTIKFNIRPLGYDDYDKYLEEINNKNKDDNTKPENTEDKNIEAEDSETKTSESKDSEVKESESKDAYAEDAQTKNIEVEDSEIKQGDSQKSEAEKAEIKNTENEAEKSENTDPKVTEGTEDKNKASENKSDKEKSNVDGNIKTLTAADELEKAVFEACSTYGIGGVIISDDGYELISKSAGEIKDNKKSLPGLVGTKNDSSISGNLSAAVNNYITYLNSVKKDYKDLTLLAEPYEAKDSLGRKTIKFNIKELGYDDYDKYLEEVNSKI